MTGLSREMQARVNPSAIVEFTATPHLNSNILHNVTAQELKREEMIKLPIVLTEHADWQSAVSGAVANRAALAEKALLETADYIRPIVLFQAQPRDEDVTVEVLKKHLIETENITEEKIAVATGDQRELDAIDLFDPRTKIEFVITVEALKEGWDCSFAYVFCSVSKIRSATAVEQLLGRVLRMPYAKRRASPELNKAYAHIAEPVFTEAAKALVDRLVDNPMVNFHSSFRPRHPLGGVSAERNVSGLSGKNGTEEICSYAIEATPLLRSAQMRDRLAQSPYDNGYVRYRTQEQFANLS